MEEKPALPKPIDFMHSHRVREWQVALSIMPTGGSFLDYGAGTGIMAALARDNFEEVAAIDIVTSNYKTWFNEKIITYDGVTIPYPDEYFDLVFSSHALLFGNYEHVQRELARVLKPQGRCVHIVPTAAARICVAGMHFVTLPFRIARSLIRVLASVQDARTESAVAGTSRVNRGPWQRLLPATFDPSISFTKETWLFRPAIWRKRFAEFGWVIEAEAPTYAFGSSWQLLGDRFSARWREIFSRIFGSHSHVFVLRRSSAARSTIA